MGVIQTDVKNQKTAKRQKPKAGFIPLSRAEHRRLETDLPAGARQGCRAFFAGAGRPFEKPRFKSSERRK